MRNFILSCESTTDLSYSYLNEREIAVIPYTYIIHEHVYEDNMERNPDLMPKYYKMLEKGCCLQPPRSTKLPIMISLKD